MSLRFPVNNKDHVQGNTNAKIELVEYGDYQCPYCGQAYYELKKIQKELGNDLKFVFRNFPLTNMHEHALNAAITAEVAGNFGKFWKMHDILFENQDALDDKHLIKYAEQLDIDTQEFESKFTESEYETKIEGDLESGLRSGVNGTPSFFINGQKYNGNYQAEEMLEYLRSI